MSIRAIASVGVMLCIAVTSLSIYLGVVEHVYAPREARSFAPGTMHQILISGLGDRAPVCEALRNTSSTSSGSPGGTTVVTSCKGVRAALK